MKVIVGAGNTQQAGWLALQQSDLDIRDARAWASRFAPASLDAILAEHVLEHLTPTEAQAAVNNFRDYLKPGGYARLAVPDANNPNPTYKDLNAPGGSWQGVMRMWVYAPEEPTHQVFYNLQSFTTLLEGAGFNVKPLEFYGADGEFYKGVWSCADGEIRRSYGHSYIAIMQPLTGVYNTSLIVDAIKE